MGDVFFIGGSDELVFAGVIYCSCSLSLEVVLNGPPIRLVEKFVDHFPGIDQAVRVVLEDLEAQAKPIATSDEINQVATIASNSDKEIGDMIAKAFDKVGKDGTITVKEGKTLKHELEVVDGCKFDRGYISPYFISNTKTSKV